jgi:hypothetical protein
MHVAHGGPALALMLTTAACSLVQAPQATDYGGSPPPEVDAQLVLDRVANGAYRTSSQFTQITRAPYASMAAMGAWIEEWVSAEGVEAYERVRPDQSGSGVTVPPGTIIVREVRDGDGAVTALTLMCKGPSGYNASLGDWWFAKTDPSGVPLTSGEDPAIPETGQVAACYSCHEPRAADDYLFGVPTDDRN